MLYGICTLGAMELSCHLITHITSPSRPQNEGHRQTSSRKIICLLPRNQTSNNSLMTTLLLSFFSLSGQTLLACIVLDQDNSFFLTQHQDDSHNIFQCFLFEGTYVSGLAPNKAEKTIESASRPLVCFGGLIDTTIKGLTILLSIWAEIDYHICYICDEMYQCSRQNSYDKMNATTWSSMRMITSNEYCVNWDMCYWWRIYSHI